MHDNPQQNLKHHKLRACLYWGWAVILITTASLKLLGPDQDIYVYISLLHLGELASNALRFEPTAAIIKDISNGEITVFFFIYAALGIGLKFFAFQKISKELSLLVFGYSITFFLLHDYTQIRAGVASAILLLAIPDIAKQKPVNFIIKALIATLFHYSAAIFIIIYPIAQLFKTRTFTILPLAGLIIAIINPPTQSILDYITGANETIYLLISSKRGHSDIVPIFTLSQTAYLTAFLILSRFTGKMTSNDIAAFKIFSLSLFIYYATIPLQAPVITYRTSELLLITSAILITNLPSYFKPKFIPYLCVILFYTLHSYHLIFNLNLI